MTAGQSRFHAVGDVSGVGRRRDLHAAVMLKNIADAAGAVVTAGKAFHREAADALGVYDRMHRHVLRRYLQGGRLRRVDARTVFSCEHAQRRRVVAVLVGYENSVDRPERGPESAERQADVLRVHSRVNKYRYVAVGNVGAVARGRRKKRVC